MRFDCIHIWFILNHSGSHRAFSRGWKCESRKQKCIKESSRSMLIYTDFIHGLSDNLEVIHYSPIHATPIY